MAKITPINVIKGISDNWVAESLKDLRKTK